MVSGITWLAGLKVPYVLVSRPREGELKVQDLVKLGEGVIGSIKAYQIDSARFSPDGRLFVTYQVDRKGEEGRWVVYRSDLRSKMEVVPPEGHVIHGPVGWLGDKIVMTGFRRGTSEQYTWAVEATCGI